MLSIAVKARSHGGFNTFLTASYGDFESSVFDDNTITCESPKKCVRYVSCNLELKLTDLLAQECGEFFKVCCPVERIKR